MTFNTIIFCASAFLVQAIAGQAISCGSGSVPVSTGCGCGAVAVPSNGGALVVTSLGPLAPAGIAAATELALAADLALSGAVPFLSAVAFEGTLPTTGSGSVAYGCGDGNIAITQEIGNPGGSNAANAFGRNAASAIGNNAVSAIGSNTVSAISSNAASAISSNAISAIGSNAAFASGLTLDNVGLGSCSAMNQARSCGSSVYNNLGSYGVNSLNSFNLNSGLVAPAVNLPLKPAASSYNLGNAALNSLSSGSCATYGGAGTGQVGVAGDVSACGNTVVAGSVPVLGAVEFSGVLPATGSVFIPGQCGCGC